jgi:predicted nucleic acid-binding protein
MLRGAQRGGTLRRDDAASGKAGDRAGTMHVVRQRRAGALRPGRPDYLATVASAARAGLPGGKVCDALILACAGKAGAEVVYTLNAKDFERIAPDLAGRIQSP